jgi:adenosylmethionine-8-amino-7-oxononanoate aminotransferase
MSPDNLMVRRIYLRKATATRRSVAFTGSVVYSLAMSTTPTSPADAPSAVFYRSPSDEYPIIVRGEGPYLWDRTGARFLDVTAGFASPAILGGGRPEIADAMARQARQLAFIHNARVSNDRQEELAHRLAGLSMPHLDKVIFSSGGSEANEIAMRIARQYHLAHGDSDRWKIISLDQSYHGSTIGALSMTGRADIRRDYSPMIMDFPKIPPPITYRGPLAGLDEHEAVERCVGWLVEAIERAGPHTVSAFIGEPMSFSTGFAVPPPGYWAAIREVCDQYGLLLIADEIITGVHRTGPFLCMEHFGVTPDIATLAKGLGGGYVPLGATLIHSNVADSISEAKRRMPEAHTYSGSPLSCAIGLAVLDVIAAEELPAAGLGSLWGIELVASKTDRSQFAGEDLVASTLFADLWDKGFVLGCARFDSPLVGDVVTLTPPLIISRSELADALAALKEALGRLIDPLAGP